VTQPELDFARTRRDDGLRRVEDNAGEEWLTLARRALSLYLLSHAEFFVDDFWRESGLERPRESRALGAVVRWAARERLMEKTGEYRPSVASNLTGKPVWRSLVCGGTR
jgi:hypothetical protein